MNNGFLHYKKNNLNILYLIICSMLILFDFYKNGILVYKAFPNNIIMLLKPLVFPIISLLVTFIFNFIFEKKFRINDNIIYFLLLSMIIPINTSIIIFFVIILALNLLNYFIINKFNLSINYVVLFKIFIIAILILLNKYNYANNLEIVGKYSYNLMDIFIGRGISGVCSSSIILILIGYAVFSTNIYYKNDIPLISIGVYAVCALLLKLIFSKVIIINSLIIFSLVLIAPLNNFSPAIKKQRIIYSVVLGILTCLFTYYINMYDGVTLAILVSSFINLINFK